MDKQNNDLMCSDEEKIEKLNKMIAASRRAVFFGGAGVSTESGIPDFRSVDGLYNIKYAYPPETILSHSFFMHNPQEFYRFYFDKMIYLEAKPNAAHIKLAQLEKRGVLQGVITQNIDGLHYDAGSRNVCELHGSVRKNHCVRCGKRYSLDDVLVFKPDVPHCDCGGIIKPDVVLYEEQLDECVLQKSVNLIASCDLLIIGGTSLSVYPAAGLIRYADAPVVLINKSATSCDKTAELVVNQPIGWVFDKIK